MHNGAVLQELGQIFFLVLKKCVLIGSSRSNYALTIYYRFPALLTLSLYHLDALSLIPFGNWGGWGISRWKLGEMPQK